MLYPTELRPRLVFYDFTVPYFPLCPHFPGAMLHMSYTKIERLEGLVVQMRIDPVDHLGRPMTGKGLSRQNASFPDSPR